MKNDFKPSMEVTDHLFAIYMYNDASHPLRFQQQQNPEARYEC